MAIDSPKRPFSKRYGYQSQPKEITIREDAPENLRHFVLDTAVEMEFWPRDDAPLTSEPRSDTLNGL